MDLLYPRVEPVYEKVVAYVAPQGTRGRQISKTFVYSVTKDPSGDNVERIGVLIRTMRDIDDELLSIREMLDPIFSNALSKKLIIEEPEIYTNSKLSPLLSCAYPYADFSAFVYSLGLADAVTNILGLRPLPEDGLLHIYPWDVVKGIVMVKELEEIEEEEIGQYSEGDEDQLKKNTLVTLFHTRHHGHTTGKLRSIAYDPFSLCAQSTFCAISLQIFACYHTPHRV